MASHKARIARAVKYANNLERRQGTLTDDELIRAAPFIVRRSIEITCAGASIKTVLMGPFTVGSVKDGMNASGCGGEHTLGKRGWVVTFKNVQNGEVTLEKFNCVLMAKALRDDLNTKAAVAIMRRESNANAGT